MGHTDFKKHILELISKEEGKPIPHAIVAQKLIQKRIAQPFNKKDIYTDIDSLLKEGSLRLTKTNKLVMGIQQSTDEVDTSIPPQQGTIAITTSGSGFITLENEKKSKYYVYRTNTNGSLSGDKVEFSVLKKQDKKDLLDAIVTSVVSRNKNFFVCTYETTESGYKLTPEDSKVFLEFVLDSTTDLVSGSVLLLQVGKFEGNKAYATVSRVIGFKTDIGVDILSLVLDNGVEPEFDQDVNDYANNIKIEIDEHQREIRHDLTNLPIITIDPATSKDFDDAIYVRKEGDDYLLSVSIADVSHYVKYDSVLDKAALKRGCSIYLVDRVIPMIPHILSNDICSINPNVDRLCLTCDMIINNNGEIKDIKVFPSIVNSHRRYSYDEVNEYFSGKSTLEKDSDEVKEVLDIGAELHAILTKSKAKRGYIQFEIPEPQIIVDEKGIPTEIRKRTSGEAQKMIEDFMVAANEAVTIYADKKG
jgi:ribonuclease R